MTRDELASDLERVACADAAAFVRVYHATSRKLFGVVVRILGRGDLADEVLQDVYLRVWQRAGEYSAGRASPITWLVTIARNRALDERRRRPMVSLDDVPGFLDLPSGEDVASDILEREQWARLQAFLSDLPEQRRRILELVYFEGATRDAVARAFDQTPGTISTWIRSDLIKLRRLLEQ